MFSELVVFGFLQQFLNSFSVLSVFIILIVNPDHTLNLPACAPSDHHKLKGPLFFMHGLLVMKCSNYTVGSASSTCFEIENNFIFMFIVHCF